MTKPEDILYLPDDYIDRYHKTPPLFAVLVRQPNDCMRVGGLDGAPMDEILTFDSYDDYSSSLEKAWEDDYNLLLFSKKSANIMEWYGNGYVKGQKKYSGYIVNFPVGEYNETI